MYVYIFFRLDRDGDGKISQEDWLEALTLAGADVTMYEADFQNRI